MDECCEFNCCEIKYESYIENESTTFLTQNNSSTIHQYQTEMNKSKLTIVLVVSIVLLLIILINVLVCRKINNKSNELKLQPVEYNVPSSFANDFVKINLPTNK